MIVDHKQQLIVSGHSELKEPDLIVREAACILGYSDFKPFLLWHAFS